MKLACPRCAQELTLDDQSAGRTVRCAQCGKSFVAPRELQIIGRKHTLQPFSLASVALLHYVTASLFSIIYLNLLHERMPRLRRTDPSAAVAIGMCFVPVINMLWFFFTFHRLCLRINEQRRLNGLAPTAPEWMVLPMCVLLTCGAPAAFVTVSGLYALGTLGLVLMPVFAVLIQHSVNELCSEPAGSAPAVA